MANEIFGEHDFRWRVPKNGFEWQERRVFMDAHRREFRGICSSGEFEATTRWVLTDGVAVGQPFEATRYRPLRMFTGLFRTFGETPQTRDGVLAFANRYGYLGIGRPLRWPTSENSNQLLLVSGELFDEWVIEIEQMRRAVSMWDMVRNSAVSELANWLRWFEGKPATATTPPSVAGWEYDSHPNVSKDKFVECEMRHIQYIEPPSDLQLGPNDIIVAAQLLYQRWINAHLEGHASPRLLYHADLGKQVLRVVPKNLLAAMWLQFAQTIEGRKEHRPCKECGKYFEVSLDEGGFRSNRLFCSDACKSRDYRHRSKRAFEMHKLGKSIKEIAQDLDTDTATIEKWTTGTGKASASKSASLRGRTNDKTKRE